MRPRPSTGGLGVGTPKSRFSQHKKTDGTEIITTTPTEQSQTENNPQPETKPTKLKSDSPSRLSIIPPNGECRYLEIKI